ncbi:MAG: glutathione S-transferase N-terminal domain-containing protein [Alphaproteobacteria bacterium]|nr:glutathione S-transferase N-terminal domain-containing protein [Alphaproteobacteria bacterium]
MKLFYSGNSPYARRARIAARASGLAVEEVDASPLAAEDHFLLQHGPGAKVPGLETDAGTYLCETLIITRYLNDLSGGKLLPIDAAAAEAVLELEGVGSLLMDTLFHCSHEKRREAGEQSPAVIAKEDLRANRCYDALDSSLAGQEAALNLGTIAAIAALGYADWRHPEHDWRSGRAGLAAWAEAMMQDQAVAETYPDF